LLDRHAAFAVDEQGAIMRADGGVLDVRAVHLALFSMAGRNCFARDLLTKRLKLT